LKPAALLALIALTSHALAAHAQWHGAADLDWKEGEVPPPPAFSTERLVPFAVSVHSELRYGLVPDSLAVGADGVVRYVWAARSPSGAVNVSYEGVRCRTREMKAYARWTPQQMPVAAAFTSADGQWRALPQAEWLSLRDHAMARPAWALAQTALCDGTTVNGNPARMLRDLRLGRPRD
jgi:hypothetical protein